MSQRLQKKYEFFRQDFDNIQTAVREVRMQCLSDRRFCSVTGAQWEGDLEQQFENKPRFEFNKVMKSVNRIISEYRNQRYDACFITKDGSEAGEMADTCASVYRSDQQDSVADEAKDNGFEESVMGGIGAWRQVDVYADEDDDNDFMRVAWEPIVDADKSVFHDLDSKRQDKKDAKRCYVLTGLTRDSYKDTYNDDPTSWPSEITQSFFDWFTPDLVFIAEVYEVEKKGEIRHVFRSLTGEEEILTPEDMEDDEKVEKLAVTGWTEVRQEKTTRRRVHKYIMSGSKILKDCGYVAGAWIPIIVTYGKRWFVEGVERCMGQVRLAKDSQRLENMQKSKLAEISAFSTVEKAILTPEQVAGHQGMWQSDNVADYPFLLLNPLKNPDGSILTTAPMAYTKVPNVPPAMVATLQLTQGDLKELLGDEQSAEEVKSNISGRVVELVQGRLDMQAYIYVSNMAKALKYDGEVWMSKANDHYVEKGRKLRGITPQGKSQPIELKRPVVNKETGAFEFQNDFSKAMLDVVVEVGPSSQSKRSSVVRAMGALLPVVENPQDKEIITATIMQNIEGEGIKSINDFYHKKLVRLGVEKPNEQETKELAEEQAALAKQPPSPNDQFLLAEAKKAKALTVESQSKVVLNAANTEKAQSEAVKNLAGVELDKREQIINLATVLDQPA